MKEDVQAAEDALRSAGFARPSQMWGDVPKFQKEELESEIADCRARIEQIENEVKDLSDQRAKIKNISGLLQSTRGQIRSARSDPAVGENVCHKRIHSSV